MQSCFWPSAIDFKTAGDFSYFCGSEARSPRKFDNPIFLTMCLITTCFVMNLSFYTKDSNLKALTAQLFGTCDNQVLNQSLHMQRERLTYACERISVYRQKISWGWLKITLYSVLLIHLFKIIFSKKVRVYFLSSRRRSELHRRAKFHTSLSSRIWLPPPCLLLTTQVWIVMLLMCSLMQATLRCDLALY